MHAVVTGGAGFIGSTLVDRLLAEGNEVDVLDNLSTGSRTNLKRAEKDFADNFVFHEVDIVEPDTTALIAELHPDVVFHLAAQADVRVSVARPAFDASVNIIGSLNVIEGARLARSHKLVFASSGGTIYGDVDPQELPVAESHTMHPLSPYGVSKKAVCDYLLAYKELHGLDYTALALANVYGPRQDPHGEAGVVAIFAGRLLARQSCVIYGNGDQTRDFVYVDDVVDAFLQSATKGGGLIINVGTGVETSVSDLYVTMAQAAGFQGEPAYGSARVGELERSSLAIIRAQRELDWIPRTSLPDGAISVLNWFETAKS